MRMLWVEGALLRSLERHSQGGSAREEVSLGGCWLQGTWEDSQGPSPRLPGETIRGRWAREIASVILPPAGDGDHPLDCARNRTLGLWPSRR